MSIFSAISEWFKDSPPPVAEEEMGCACGNQCTCGNSSQQEPVAISPVTEEDTQVETQEEITVGVNTVVEEIEKIAEVVVEEKETLSDEVIAAADAAAAVMLEQALTRTTDPTSVTDSQPKPKRKRKVSKKARKKK